LLFKKKILISEGDFLSTKNYPLQLAELEFGFFPTCFQEFPITSTAQRSLGGKPGRQRGVATGVDYIAPLVLL
jgi:hypothetical protein